MEYWHYPKTVDLGVTVFGNPGDLQNAFCLFFPTENKIPPNAILVGSHDTFEGDKKHTDTYYLLPGDSPSQTRTVRTTEKRTTRYEGVGPTDAKTGVPLVPRGVSDT